MTVFVDRCLRSLLGELSCPVTSPPHLASVSACVSPSVPSSFPSLPPVSPSVSSSSVLEREGYHSDVSVDWPVLSHIKHLWSNACFHKLFADLSRLSIMTMPSGINHDEACQLSGEFRDFIIKKKRSAECSSGSSAISVAPFNIIVLSLVLY